MSNTPAINYRDIMKQLGFAKPANCEDAHKANRFEPIATILSHCEETTGTLMPAH